jgi:glutamate synthase domain-containing protein 3
MKSTIFIALALVISGAMVGGAVMWTKGKEREQRADEIKSQRKAAADVCATMLRGIVFFRGEPEAELKEVSAKLPDDAHLRDLFENFRDETARARQEYLEEEKAHRDAFRKSQPPFPPLPSLKDKEWDMAGNELRKALHEYDGSP